jgi:hypothetical protein
MKHIFRRLTPIAMLGTLAFAACAKKSDSASDSPAMSQPASPSGNAPGPDGAEQTKEAGTAGTPSARAETRKIIRTGSLRLTVATYDEARAKLDAILEQVGGYVDSTQVNRGSNAVTDATIVVRIPSTAFGDIVPKLRELGEITSESTNAADITDQYLDIEARMTSAKTLEKRLLELVAERNGTIDSVLAVERELARVRGEIESYEGRMRQWNDQIAMSTLTLTLSTKAPEIVASSTSFTGRISNTFHDSVSAMRDFGGWLVIAGTALLPWLLIVLPALLVIRRLDRGGYVTKLRQRLWK